MRQRGRTLPVPIPRARHGGKLMDLLELPSHAATTRQVPSGPHYVQRQGSLDSLVNYAAFLHEARSILIFRMLVQMTIGNPALSWASSVTVRPPLLVLIPDAPGEAGMGLFGLTYNDTALLSLPWAFEASKSLLLTTCVTSVATAMNLTS